ncbi:hypothetical protein KWD60_11735 [Acinetobacter baumannii]|nr:hypothetical protein [Acinetobacter baumannii]
MLVKINPSAYVLASDVVSVIKNQITDSEHFGKWYAMVKTDQGLSCYEIPESEVAIFVQDINRFSEKRG